MREIRRHRHHIQQEEARRKRITRHIETSAKGGKKAKEKTHFDFYFILFSSKVEIQIRRKTATKVTRTTTKTANDVSPR